MARDVLLTLYRGAANVRRPFARIGILVRAKVMHVTTVAGTMCAASVVNLTQLRTKPTAMQLSTVDANSKEQQQLKAAASKAQKAQATGTRQLKRKGDDQLSEIPRYKRGFVWEKPSPSSRLSPSALATEKA